MEKIIKKIKAYCVIQGGYTVATDKFIRLSYLALETMDEAMCIFSSKKKALTWIKQWKNHEDFTIVEINFKIPKCK